MKLRNKKKRKMSGIILITCVVMIIALVLEAVFLNFINKRNFKRTSEVLLNQVIEVLKKNQTSENDLIESLKEDYMVRAKAVAYIIDSRPDIIDDVDELRKIASLMAVDEIHLFDSKGMIYAGTNPEYYGYNFDSGEQLAYFKPMLEDKTLTMCQDVMPNTSQGKKMMYAITWNDGGNKMIQVGIEPKRLLEEVKQNEVSTVVSNMPMYDGLSIFVANPDTGEIYGCSDEAKMGMTLDQIGIARADYVPEEEALYIGVKKVAGVRSRCVFKRSGSYLVGVTYDVAVNRYSNGAVMVIMAMYLFLSAWIVIRMIRKAVRADNEKHEQLSILTSMSGIYYSMYMLNLRDDTFVQYSAGDMIRKAATSSDSAGNLMRGIAGKVIADGHRERAQEFLNLASIGERLKKKKIISGEFILNNLGWFRLSFISIEVDENGVPWKVIFTSRSIDDDKRREEKLIRRSYIDELTGCYNRRAYKDDTRELQMDTEYVYVSMDVNGLKPVNDNLGHSAGDELLKGAASCMKQCFDSYGKVYRMGGDEFAAIIFVNERRLRRIQEEFSDTLKHWSGQQVKSLSISCGYVASTEKNWQTLDDIVKTADERMYENKAEYYRQNGIERRRV